MSDYIITCCSTTDLSLEVFIDRKIPFLSFSFNLDNQEYLDDYGKSIELKTFYDKMREGHIPTTSQISVGRYEDFFRPYLEKGLSIIHLCLSSGITGTFNSANLAANMLNDEYDAKVTIIDSLSASSGYGMLALIAKDNLDNGYSYNENIEVITKIRYQLAHWFFPSELTYLMRGGRVSKVNGLIGNALHIIPILNVDNDGHLVPQTKVRGKKKALNYLLDKMKEKAIGQETYDGRVFISHADDLKTAEFLKDEILNIFKNIKSVDIYNIGTVIGAHAGPGTIALFFMAEDRS